MHLKLLRGLALGVAAASFVVLFMYGMAPERFMMVFLAAGTTLFAALAAFFATFVYGPLSYPRRSSEAMLSWVVLVFLACGLLAVGSAAARQLFALVAGAA